MVCIALAASAGLNVPSFRFQLRLIAKLLSLAVSPPAKWCPGIAGEWPVGVLECVRSDDFSWLSYLRLEIYQKYAGKWIAVLIGEIIGVGATATEAAAQAEASHPDSEYLLEGVDAEPERV